MTAPRANIYAVAERAGVSIATVSRVQRGVGPVSTETRERVEQAIDELGYSPDPTGRALAGQRLDAMGIVFPDLAGPYYSSVLLGAEAASVTAGSSLLILATHGRPRAEELILSGRYQDALQELSTLRGAVDRFFDEVLVMAEDQKLRQNRLGLLQGLQSLFSRVADLSQLVAGQG